MKNMSIGQILSMSFGILILMTVIIGTMGIYFTQLINTNYVSTVVPGSKALDYLSDMWLYYDDIKYEATNALASRTPEEASKALATFDNDYEEVLSAFEKVASMLEPNGKITLSGEDKEAFDTVAADVKILADMQKELKEAIVAVDVKRIEKVKTELEESSLAEEFEEALDKVYYAISDMTSEQTAERTNDTVKFTVILIVALIASALISVVFAFLISKMLKDGIGNAVSAAKQIADGDLNVTLQSSFHNEIGELTNSVNEIANTFRDMLTDINYAAECIENGDMHIEINADSYNNDYKNVISAVNHTLNLLNTDLKAAVDTMSDYADGNFASPIKEFKGEKAIISYKLGTVKENLKNIAEDIEMLINSAAGGNLKIAASSDKYSGDWKKIIEDLNSLMTAVERPITEVSNILSNVAQADFSKTLSGDFNGEFKYLQNSVNKTIENNSAYIKEISATLTQMANNDLNIHMVQDYIGEYSAIKNAIENIAQSFSILLTKISSSAEEISIGSKQVASSSTDIANGAETQAISVAKLTDTVKSLLSSVKENQQIMLENNQKAAAAKAKTDAGKNKTEQMLEAMDAISKASGEIANINKTISDIAFQTNILALNAAVEAARAGEAGKGFAVVADEVGTLASRSQNAVKYTDELITNVLEKISAGSQAVTETAEMLDEVSENVDNISETLIKGAELSNTQYKAVIGINEEINSINNVTQNNTAVSQEAAAASEELASQSEMFNETLSRFKVKRK